MDDQSNHSSDSESESKFSGDDNIDDGDLVQQQLHNSDSENMASKYDMSDTGLKYAGNPNDDLDLFLARFKDYSSLRDYTDAKSVLALQGLIVGNARIFLSRVPSTDRDTVNKIQKLLKDQFEGPSWLWSVESQLLSRKQMSSESLDDYASDIMLWGRQTNKPDAELKSIFVRGLLPNLRGFVFSKQPESFQAALNAARLAISVQRTTEEQPLVEQPHTKAVQPQVSQVNDDTHSALKQLTNLVSNIATRLDGVENNMRTTQNSVPSNSSYYRRNPRPTRSVVCFRCGYTGHKWMNCYAKKGIDGRPLN